MSEGHRNVEVAHVLHERSHHQASDGEPGPRSGRWQLLEILEGVTLAIVAIVTAWSSYQAAQWDGRSAESYAEATAKYVAADEAATLGGQRQLHDLGTFNAWLLAETMDNQVGAEMLERRFSPAYLVAFKAWLETDPMHSRSAPPGPMWMPQYHNPAEESAKSIRRQAAEAMETGKSCRRVGEEYVRAAVFLATVLFLVAVSQRFKDPRARVVLLGISVVLMSITLYQITTFPRA